VQKFICSQNESQDAFEFALSAGVGMLSPLNSSFQNSANTLISKIHQLFSRDLAWKTIACGKMVSSSN
jgi:hypothetical protein